MVGGTSSEHRCSALEVTASGSSRAGLVMNGTRYLAKRLVAVADCRCLITILFVTSIASTGCLAPKGDRCIPAITPVTEDSSGSGLDTAVSSEDFTLEPANNLGHMVEFEAMVTAIQERYPPGLQARDPSGKTYQVSLWPDTKITRKGKSLDMGDLLAGMHVRVVGEVVSSAGVRATAIQVLR